MKKAFTLIELLVVTLVIVILASITFKLVGTAGDAEPLQTTIIRMQRLENCLSGYYAAFGSYPPVELHGSRNPFYKVSKYGYIQQTENEDPDYSKLDENRVRAACRAQPVRAEFPFVDENDRKMAVKVSDTIQLLQQDEAYVKSHTDKYGNVPACFNPFDALETPNQLNGKKDESRWAKIQMFKFGLLSFLVPRYLMMMGHDYNTMYKDFHQWSDKNTRPCRFEDGVQYPSWDDLNQDLRQNKNERWKIDLIPSQSVTQRWLPNLEGICRSGSQMEFYGIKIGDGTALDPEEPERISVYSTGESQAGESASATQPYVLDSLTVEDGWHNDFYYYSPPPYQNYILWSSGPNGKTFPPWISDEEVRKDPDISKFEKTIRSWIADDIVHLSH